MGLTSRYCQGSIQLKAPGESRCLPLPVPGAARIPWLVAAHSKLCCRRHTDFPPIVKCLSLPPSYKDTCDYV